MSLSRREFVTHAVAGAAVATTATSAASSPPRRPRREERWPNGARLAISISMQFEAGAQPERGASGPFPAIDSRYPDLPTATWYEYGFKEGLPRLLDVFERQGVKVTSHMVGAAVDKNPALAREIVQRGHEAAAHGQTWTPQFSMTREEERASYEANIQSILRATGTRPVGFNAFWMRGTPQTLPLLQELGFLYHIDDVSRDEPFLVPVAGKPFVVVPYTLGLNDIVLFEERHFSADQFASELRLEFDALLAESATRRRMMSISVHDRIGGRPARARVLEEFIAYAKRQPGVWFARKDELARIALDSPLTPREGSLATPATEP
ncbi:polysaccharide deacetylase family protein [Myxococcus landrumensis]|uniref:Polysaccharide deacetylase family protein n=1 Tax=Myxococcus landrumensis TaxID=2813577 RepID=A0ABX7N7S4_9BACT|nr:polysaccharide deacetylase family protein [Myxococcus landrumus]QSQ13471.1 polysaccharide deacetylase family protein [Myxococcus landrumus]